MMRALTPGMTFRVLIVDDEEDIRMVLSDQLETEGFTVRTASEAGGAVEALRGEPFDVVLTDIRMPGKSGIELLEDVQRIDSHLSSIVMSSDGRCEMARASLEAGAMHFMVKPMGRSDLIEVVRAAAAATRARR